MSLSAQQTFVNVLLSSVVKLCPHFLFIDNSLVNIFDISISFGIDYKVEPLLRVCRALTRMRPTQKKCKRTRSVLLTAMPAFLYFRDSLF